MSRAWPLDQLPSKVDGPAASYGAAKRIDPHYDGVWSAGSSAAWTTYATWRRQRDAGIADTPRALLDPDPQKALDRLASGREWDRILRVVAALTSFRTLTAEQLACVTGIEQIGTGRSTLMADLFSMGLVDIGEYQRPFASPSRARFGGRVLYRPGRPAAAAKLIEPLCTFEELASVTGGQEWSSSGQYDRHNILTCEAMLRVAEFAPQIVGVLGERFATTALAAYSSVGDPAPPEAEHRRADGMLIREDGMRIVVELTASVSKGFNAKVEKWAAALASRRYDRTGVVVLFLAAPISDAQRARGSKPLAVEIEGQVRIAASKYRGVPMDPTVSRMAVAKWEDWFPERGAASREMLVGEVARISAATGEWERARLLDPAHFPRPGNDALREGLRNLAGMRQTPPWMLDRLGEAPELWRHATPAFRTGEPFAPAPQTGIGTIATLPPRMLPAGPRGVAFASGRQGAAKMDRTRGGRHG